MSRAVWLEFLRASFVANKPWDVLAREILSAEDADPKQLHRAKFFLDRDAEPNVVTRDISRLFLGTNFQCCQCHDHPIVDDYKQEHYYGLFAFVSRSSLLLDRKTRAAQLAEKADGEVTYQSVFDPKKITKTALPCARAARRSRTHPSTRPRRTSSPRPRAWRPGRATAAARNWPGRSRGRTTHRLDVTLPTERGR